MSKKILTVGLDLASDNAVMEAFESKASLLDWDLILFRPDIPDGIYSSDYYKGKPSLGDSASFLLKEKCEHWRREIKQAVDSGKNVFIFLSAIKEVYVDTGERQHSGTGRNRATTRIVDLYSNYATVPLDLKPVSTNGKAMKLSTLGAEILAPYWDAFAENSSYAVLLDKAVPGICLTTKHGDKPVGAIIRAKHSNGALVLLPDIDFYASDFLEDDDEEGAKWTTKAEEFAVRFLSTVINLDKALKSTTEVTPEPLWAAESAYMLAQERVLKLKLLEAERRVEEAQREKETLQESVSAAATPRALLYEKGKPLETAIVEGLKTLGFAAAQFKDGTSEFDVVFECAEGRLLGEAEGKDTKAVNVDKLRQLAMNIHEDLQREEVTAPAKGVLFGNGYRLIPPLERNTQFTDKCITAATSQVTALVTTSSLFKAVKYMSGQEDDEYASKCRTAILVGIGLVELPEPPNCQVGQISDDTSSGDVQQVA
ncbi:hypothetical protein Jab_2c20460 [Janthinobacterium sp. HH01]|uniref:hypothetical protein n=1 Tax=Janthinobacterium sp. HH01 TaxID=1198452 RepID=UPI0002AEBA6B|nr:hypothetical protein [Janthinobacterium sp. HH01]ELX09962.1 hypothetical protein Jab_2c20460 [Janthinobacterium sp. HH01]